MEEFITRYWNALWHVLTIWGPSIKIAAAISSLWLVACGMLNLYDRIKRWGTQILKGG